MDQWSCGWIHVTFTLPIISADITNFSKAIIVFAKMARFLVNVKTSTLPVTSSMPVTIITAKTLMLAPQVGRWRQLLNYDVSYVKLELAPWKNSVPHRVQLIMHTKRKVEVRLSFCYIAGFQGWSIKTTVTECGGIEVQNDTTMLNKTWGRNT